MAILTDRPTSIMGSLHASVALLMSPLSGNLNLPIIEIVVVREPTSIKCLQHGERQQSEGSLRRKLCM
jgi:hypothetical protein